MNTLREMDKLQKIFQLQEDFQKRLQNDITSQEFRTTNTLAAIVELSEFIQETPWKPWKKTASLNLPKAREEIIDVWHFVINLSLSVGMTSDDVFYEFQQKNRENNARQDRGY